MILFVLIVTRMIARNYKNFTRTFPFCFCNDAALTVLQESLQESFQDVPMVQKVNENVTRSSQIALQFL